jgi:arsenate reductase
MTGTIQILHNPRCSKSRQTLALIEEKGIQPEIVLYLENTPSNNELKNILSKLGISARELLRKGEQDYKDNNLSDLTLSEEDLITKMIQFPKLIERPIVIKNNQAVLGRPPENVLDLL